MIKAQPTSASRVFAENLVLSPEEEVEFQRQREILRAQLQNPKFTATYKLEVQFGKARSTHKPTPGVISFWASGTKLHGGGDSKLYLCPGDRERSNGCTRVLPEDYRSDRGVVCPSCGVIWKSEDLIGELMFNLSMQNWAEVVYRYYRILQHDCDIYLKHAPDDMRANSRAQAEHQTWRGTKLLDGARDKRVRYIYPLRNILKDSNAGSDLVARFRAFLTS